ncbi:MAG: hypothetical protein M3530_02490 [Thermoproteota archaeon]|nr:hypothetical protein [Thermoproteota archaeon]
MLFHKKKLNDIDEVKGQILKIISKRDRDSLSSPMPSTREVQDLLSEFSEFNPKWKKFPILYRIARIKISDPIGTTAFQENVELPDVKHDLDLIIKMLNHMRQQKNLKAVKMPLFINPDEIYLAHKEGRFPFIETEIMSQIIVVFQKGQIMYVGLVFGRNYVLLQD